MENWDIEFTVPGNPKALKRHRSFQRGKFRGTYDPSQGDKANFLAKAMENKPDVPFDEPLYVVLIFRFGRPKSHFRTGKYSDMMKPGAPARHTGRPDIDNLIKFVLDSFSGIFWKDDTLISNLYAEKLYSSTPRVEIKINRL